MTKIDIKEQVVENLNALKRKAESVPTQTTTQPKDDAPSVSNGVKPALYELDRYVKYRDLIMTIGMLFIAYGVSRISITLMFILSGLGLIGISWMMAR